MTMTRQNVNIGIIGAGLMGREIATAIQRWPALIDHPVSPRVTAVCDINPQAMDWFDQLDTVKTKVTDYKDLLSDDEVDVVYIAVRHDLHEVMYIDAINAGKDLFAEKPFGIDLVAAQHIVEAIDAHPNAFVRCSSEMPFFPGAQQALTFIQTGVLGQIIEVRSSFLHASDLDRNKPINWKRQTQFCGQGGVMNDLGLHALHVPFRLGWNPSSVFSTLQNLVPSRPGADGLPVLCDTFDNATLTATVDTAGHSFPLTIETKRIAPGHMNTWELEAIGLDGGVRFSTKYPKTVNAYSVVDVPGLGSRQVWQSWDAGSQSVWPTVTGAIFESGFSDAILQMWAAFLAERAGKLDGGFGCVTPAEALRAHGVIAAALDSHASRRAMPVQLSACASKP